MFQYRQVLVRLRQGDSDRDIARSRLMGRRKVAALRGLAADHGWLAPDVALHVNLDKTADLTKETSSVQAASVKRC